MTENQSINQSINQYNTNSRQRIKGIPMPLKAVGVGAGLGIAALFNMACPQATESTPPKECNCPDGMAHFGTCCDTEDCNCIAIREYIINDIEGMKPITIEDRSNGLFTDAMKDDIKRVINTAKNDGLLFYLRTRDNVIIIVEKSPVYDGNKNAEKINGRKMKIRIDFLLNASTLDFEDEVGMTLIAMNNDNDIAKLNKSNSDIRLANAIHSRSGSIS